MNFHRKLYSVFYILILSIFLLTSSNIAKCQAFPIYAQQSYENPREATGRIVCANCHLAQKAVSIEVPQSVLPNTVFEATVKIPYNNQQKQVLGDGSEGPLNMGAIVILPKGFKLASKNQIPKDIQIKNKGIYIQPYSKKNNNILVVGPIPSTAHQEITFPIISPDPANNKNIHFLKYPVYVGGNRGRGQIYPSGEKSNNNTILATVTGQIQNIKSVDNDNLLIEVKDINNSTVNQLIPKGINLTVALGDSIKQDEPLTIDPNVGGFGQSETEIVLQSPKRIQGMIIFFLILTFAQVFFVLKKKQFEKVQAFERNF